MSDDVAERMKELGDRLKALEARVSAVEREEIQARADINGLAVATKDLLASVQQIHRRELACGLLADRVELAATRIEKALS